MTSQADISVALKRLTDSLPPPRGISMDKAFPGYVAALTPFALDEIDEAIRRYLSAEFPKISLKFYPRAPELASIVRQVRAERAQETNRELRAVERAREAAEAAESEKLRHHSPEQRLKVAQAYRRFLETTASAERQLAAEARERQRAETRARYGMTDEVLAGVEDRPLPKGMAPLGETVPGIPAPENLEDLPMFGEEAKG